VVWDMRENEVSPFPSILDLMLTESGATCTLVRVHGELN
jgi:hypothetical protein